MNVQDIIDDAGKENVDIANRMRSYKEDDSLLQDWDEQQKKNKDSDDEGEVSGSSEESSEEEQMSDIKFPKENAPDLLQFIARDLNNL